MINEAPKPKLKQKVATTKKSGQTLKNFRLSQKDSKDAQDRAKRASAQAPAGGAVKTQSSAPYSAQNYKTTMAKRKADQKKAAASTAKKTKATPVKEPTIIGPSTTGGKTTPTTVATTAQGSGPTSSQAMKNRDRLTNIKQQGAFVKKAKADDAAKQKKKDDDDAADKAKKAKEKRKETRKKFYKRAAIGGAIGTALSVPVVALHMGEGRNMRTLRDVREKYTQKQRIMRDMGRNRGKDPSGAMKAKIAKDADDHSKSYPAGGAPVRDKDIERRAVGGYGGHEIERGVKKKQNYDFVPVSRDKLDSPDRPSPAERLKRKKEKDARQMKMRKSGSGRDNVGGVGVREAKMVTGNESGMMFKVSIEGLPDMIMMGKSPGEIKGQLRKIVKQPSMVQGVERIPKSKVKMMYRDIVSGRDEDE